MGARKWIFGGLLIVAIAIVAITVNVLRAEEQREQSNLATALARAKSLGLPVYADHLRQNPIPDDQNAWVELVSVGNQVPELEDDYLGIRELARITDKSDFLANAPEVLLRWESLLERAETAVERPKYAHDREWENGFWMIFPDLSEVHSIAYGLAAKSRYELLTGDREASQQTLRAAQKIALHLDAERSRTAKLTRVGVMAVVSREVVLQAQLVDAADHRDALHEILMGLQSTVDVRAQIVEDVVQFVESIRMMSEESKRGDAAREYLKEYLSPAASSAGTTVSAEVARRLEAVAIEAACDYFEALSPSPDDHVKNDELFAKLLDLPYTWVVDQDFVIGDLPYGALEIYDFMGGGSPEDRGSIYGRLARTMLAGELYEMAFDVVVGDAEPAEGESRPSEILTGAVLTYKQTETGFSITATAPDINPLTTRFDRP